MLCCRKSRMAGKGLFWIFCYALKAEKQRNIMTMFLYKKESEEKICMKLALCTNFIDGDLWRERLCAAAPESITLIDEFCGADELLKSHHSYDAVVVAQRGVAGLQTVRWLRDAGCLLPLLWIADEYDYGRFSYRYQVTWFLQDIDDDCAVRAALEKLKGVVA